MALDEFFALQTEDLRERIRHIERWASIFSGRQTLDPSAAEFTAAVPEASTGGSGTSGGTLIGDVTGPLTANTVIALRNKLLTGTETAFFVYQYDGTQWVARLLRFPIHSTAIDYTVLTTDCLVFVDASGGNRIITLPTAVGISGQPFSIKKTDTSVNTVTLATTGGQTIDGSPSAVIAVPQTALLLVSDNANYQIH